MNPAVGEVADGDILAAYVAPANHDRLALLALHRKTVLVVEGGRGRGRLGWDFLFLKMNIHSLFYVIER